MAVRRAVVLAPDAGLARRRGDGCPSPRAPFDATRPRAPVRPARPCRGPRRPARRLRRPGPCAVELPVPASRRDVEGARSCRSGMSNASRSRRSPQGEQDHVRRGAVSRRPSRRRAPARGSPDPAAGVAAGRREPDELDHAEERRVRHATPRSVRPQPAPDLLARAPLHVPARQRAARRAAASAGRRRTARSRRGHQSVSRPSPGRGEGDQRTAPSTSSTIPTSERATAGETPRRTRGTGSAPPVRRRVRRPLVVGGPWSGGVSPSARPRPPQGRPSDGASSARTDSARRRP